MALEQVGGAEQKTGISRLTLEHLYWKVLSDNELGTAEAEVAFASNTLTAKPADIDFVPAAIGPDPDNLGDPARKAIRLLVGPGGEKELTPVGDDPETYRVWVRIKIWGGPAPGEGILEQSIVRNVGTLVVR